MSERCHYQTKQRLRILQYLSQHTDQIVTAESIWMDLCDGDDVIGQTTVYRALGQLLEEGLVVKVPSVGKTCASYRYLGVQSAPCSGNMICLKCGKTIPLESAQLDPVVKSIQTNCPWRLTPFHIVLYGYCLGCSPEHEKRR